MRRPWSCRGLATASTAVLMPGKKDMDADPGLHRGRLYVGMTVSADGWVNHFVGWYKGFWRFAQNDCVCAVVSCARRNDAQWTGLAVGPRGAANQLRQVPRHPFPQRAARGGGES